jgi:hypothetical protein
MMVVHREGKHTGKMGKKIFRTLAAGVVVVPGLIAGQLATVDHIASAGTINVTSPQSLTLNYKQEAKLDFEAYTFRTSSSHLEYRSDCEGRYLKANMPGTYTVYLYNTSIDYSNNNAIGSFIVNVPYPDNNHDGVVDISDVVKNLAQHQYDDSSERSRLLNWVESSRKPINKAPTVNNEQIFEHYLSTACMSSYSLDDLFDDEDSNELTYSLVGTTPASMKTVIATEYYGDDALFYQLLRSGTTTVTVRATDYYGSSVDRPLIFEFYRDYTLYREQNVVLTRSKLGYDFGIGESESIEQVAVTKVGNHPSNLGTIDFQGSMSEESMIIDINENVPTVYVLDPEYEYNEYYTQDNIAVAVIKIDITTNLKTYTEYYRIKAIDGEQPW